MEDATRGTDLVYIGGDWRKKPERRTMGKYECFECGSEIKDGVCPHCEALSGNSQTHGSESPFCEHCKETDCSVSLDGTCEMIRRYLEAVKQGVHVCRFGISNECDVCGAKFTPNDGSEGCGNKG